MQEIERFKEEILKEYPRLNPDSKFCFECHRGVSCFNDCCADVNIFLTPYDIIRLKNRLGVSSTEFLRRHTVSPFDENLNYPIRVLKMEDNEKKTCPFVSEEGCTVYEDRPWACRMFPVGMASPGEDADEADEEFYFILKDAICKGHNESKEWTIKGWLADQGIDQYNAMGEEFKNLTLHRFFRQGEKLTPEKIEMFHTVCYDVDRFRRFLFDSTFFNKFDVDEQTRAAIKDDDVELLKFGFRWLRFALMGEKTMAVKSSVAEEAKKKLAEKTKALKPKS